MVGYAKIALAAIFALKPFAFNVGISLKDSLSHIFRL